MPRFWIAVLIAAALTSACRIERTPDEYFDHQDRLALGREDAAEELRDRILALGQAVARGSGAEAMVALAPAPDLRIVTPEADVVLSGTEALRATLDRFTATPVALQVRDVEVTVGPEGNVAWFQANVDAPGSGPQGTLLRVTGVYLRREGAWELVQAHVSMPRSPANPPLPGDSASGPPEA